MMSFRLHSRLLDVKIAATAAVKTFCCTFIFGHVYVVSDTRVSFKHGQVCIPSEEKWRNHVGGFSRAAAIKSSAHTREVDQTERQFYLLYLPLLVMFKLHISLGFPGTYLKGCPAAYKVSMQLWCTHYLQFFVLCYCLILDAWLYSYCKMNWNLWNLWKLRYLWEFV